MKTTTARRSDRSPAELRLSRDVTAKVAAAGAATPGLSPTIVQAARLLEGRATSIAETVVARIRAEVPHYGDRISGPPELGALLYSALESSVGSLANPERVLDSAEYAWNLGQLRARQGVPLLALRDCYRIWAAELWRELVEAATAHDPDDALELARSAGGFWSFCERDTKLMIESYRLASTGAAADAERKLLPMLRAFLRGHADPVDVVSAAIALDLPTDGRYAVVRVPDEAVGSGRPVRDELDGMTLYWCPQRSGLSLLVLLGDRTPTEVRVALASSYPGTLAGISPAVDGLINVGRANQLAELALRAAGAADGPVLLTDRLSMALLVARPDLSAVLAANILGPVLELDAGERAVLLDTFRAWLDADGSAARAGKVLFCHHNTVLNRLRRLERLTGLHLDRPRELVELTLALEAVTAGVAAVPVATGGSSSR
ncbi:helix-turn-helix domain-containing protein [Gordonia alkaliphila]|uniref:helix-turn-helix domain-containing protein n=1 Tax=Gordonia alkaliphila TaxID=1053547 RepID=UPI001FF4CF4C|nr:PucR family transcriptional regulator [Gordonia alkaliphila]MCK0438355.1 helix-turn-helix domain-containing protein [Gordonia alkaliphila]